MEIRRIYKLTNVATGKVYIGQTFGRPISHRFHEHMSLLERGRHPVENMQHDYDNVGKEFVCEEVAIDLDPKPRHSLEKVVMKIFHSGDQSKGYNYKDPLAVGWSEERLLKHRAVMKEAFEQSRRFKQRRSNGRKDQNIRYGVSDLSDIDTSLMTETQASYCEAYKELGSIILVAERFGVSRQAVQQAISGGIKRAIKKG